MAGVVSRATHRPALEIGVPAGRVVFHQGEPSARPLVISSGALLITTVDDEGRVLALDVAGPGDVIGEPTAAPARASARALGTCRLAPPPMERLPTLLDERDRRLLTLACHLAWLDVPHRVEQRLCDLARRFGRPRPTGTLVSLGLTQEDLANLCGTSRESANRAIRSLVARGRLELRGRGRFLVPAGQAGPEPSEASSPSCNITRLHVPQ